MNNPQKPTPGSVKNPGKTEELTIDGPVSEKDEVKAAERKMAKMIKKTNKDRLK